MKLIRTSFITIALVAFTTLFANAKATELVDIEKVNAQEMIQLANVNAKETFKIVNLALITTNEHAEALLTKHIESSDKTNKQILSYNQLIAE